MNYKKLWRIADSIRNLKYPEDFVGILKECLDPSEPEIDIPHNIYHYPIRAQFRISGLGVLTSDDCIKQLRMHELFNAIIENEEFEEIIERGIDLSLSNGDKEFMNCVMNSVDKKMKQILGYYDERSYCEREGEYISIRLRFSISDKQLEALINNTLQCYGLPLSVDPAFTDIRFVSQEERDIEREFSKTRAEVEELMRKRGVSVSFKKP